MWGLFVGILIGVLQVLALCKLGGILLGEAGAAAKLIAGLLIIVKMALIVLILYLISTVAFAHLIWAVGGMVLGLIIVSIYLMIRRKKNGENHHD